MHSLRSQYDERIIVELVPNDGEVREAALIEVLVGDEHLRKERQIELRTGEILILGQVDIDWLPGFRLCIRTELEDLQVGLRVEHVQLHADVYDTLDRINFKWHPVLHIEPISMIDYSMSCRRGSIRLQKSAFGILIYGSKSRQHTTTSYRSSSS